MKHRIFISIQLPSKIKKRLKKAIEKWQNLPIKWVPEINLHITLDFLGFISDEQLQEVCEKTRLLVENREVFDIEFEHIGLAPSKETPRMVWLFGKDSPELLRLVQDLEKELDIEGAIKKTFRPHVTLGRIQAGRWEKLIPKPEIFEKFSLLLPVESIDVMASHFIAGEKEYTALESCPF